MVIINRGRSFFYKLVQVYYKPRQVLQSGVVLLNIGTVITNQYRATCTNIYFKTITGTITGFLKHGGYSIFVYMATSGLEVIFLCVLFLCMRGRDYVRRYFSKSEIEYARGWSKPLFKCNFKFHLQELSKRFS